MENEASKENAEVGSDIEHGVLMIDGRPVSIEEIRPVLRELGYEVVKDDDPAGSKRSLAELGRILG
ncbi:MAG: hypothetical protein AAFU80_07575 [Pseudomonadota bacterium]